MVAPEKLQSLKTAPTRDELCERLEQQLLDVDLEHTLLSYTTLVAGQHGDIADQSRDVTQFVRLGELLSRSYRLREHLDIHRHPVQSGQVDVGSVITVKLDDVEETVLVGYAEERTAQFETVTPSSPLGRAVMHCRAGDTTSFLRPDRREVRVTVVEIRT